MLQERKNLVGTPIVFRIHVCYTPAGFQLVSVSASHHEEQRLICMMSGGCGTKTCCSEKNCCCLAAWPLRLWNAKPTKQPRLKTRPGFEFHRQEHPTQSSPANGFCTISLTSCSLSCHPRGISWSCPRWPGPLLQINIISNQQKKNSFVKAENEVDLLFSCVYKRHHVYIVMLNSRMVP